MQSSRVSPTSEGDPLEREYVLQPKSTQLSRTVSERFIRSSSLVALGERIKIHATWKHEILNLLAWEIKLIPSILIICACVALYGLMQSALQNLWADQFVLTHFSFGFICFSITMLYMYIGLQIPWYILVCIIAVEYGSYIGIVAFGVIEGFPWQGHTDKIFLGVAFCVPAALNLQVAQGFAGLPQSWKSMVFKMVLTLGSSFASCFVVMEYAYMTTHLNGWMLEWLVTGLAYPFASLFLGRLLVADLLSFMVLSTFPEGSVIDLMSFYTILVKSNFYFAGQVSILNVTSSYSFVIALAVTSLTELLGVYINCKLTMFFKSAARKYEDTLNIDGFFAQWLATRTKYAEQRLVMHTHDESIGEKLVIYSASLLLILDVYRSAVDKDMTSVVLRGVVTIVVEFFQDLTQRRLMQKVAGLTVTAMVPKFLSLRENVCNICVIFMARSLFVAATQQSR